MPGNPFGGNKINMLAPQNIRTISKCNAVMMMMMMATWGKSGTSILLCNLAGTYCVNIDCKNMELLFFSAAVTVVKMLAWCHASSVLW